MAVDAFDFKLNDNGDLAFEGGDFVIKESSIEHLNAIIRSVTNDYKLNPSIALNLNSKINSPLSTSTISVRRNLKDIMQQDGFDVTKLSVDKNISTNKLLIESSGNRVR